MKRIKENDRKIEKLESRMERRKAKHHRRLYEKKSVEKITFEFMRRIRSVWKEKRDKLHPVHDEEIINRYSKLTKENVKECVQLAFKIIRDLGTSLSTHSVTHETMLLLLRRAVTVCIRPFQSHYQAITDL